MKLLLALALVASTFALGSASACPDVETCADPYVPDELCLRTVGCVASLELGIVEWVEDQLGPCTCDPRD